MAEGFLGSRNDVEQFTAPKTICLWVCVSLVAVDLPTKNIQFGLFRLESERARSLWVVCLSISSSWEGGSGWTSQQCHLSVRIKCLKFEVVVHGKRNRQGCVLLDRKCRNEYIFLQAGKSYQSWKRSDVLFWWQWESVVLMVFRCRWRSLIAKIVWNHSGTYLGYQFTACFKKGYMK